VWWVKRSVSGLAAWGRHRGRADGAKKTRGGDASQCTHLVEDVGVGDLIVQPLGQRKVRFGAVEGSLGRSTVDDGTQGLEHIDLARDKRQGEIEARLASSVSERTFSALIFSGRGMIVL
jgi:hypothetical protein